MKRLCNEPAFLFWAVVLLVTPSPPHAQDQDSRPPRFEDYPANGIYSGALVAPRIVTPVQRKYRTRIREGVEKGWGVFRDGKEQAGPNFAGQYMLIRWGCGTACVLMVMVDAKTGEIYSLPLAIRGIGLPRFGYAPAEVEYRPNSRLLTMKACPGQLTGPCFMHYFLWNGKNWRLLRRSPLKPPQ